MPNKIKKTIPIIPSVLAAFFSLTLVVLSNTIQTPFKKCLLKNGIIAYLPHKRTENARNKKIIFFVL
ncbi:hypothetical protein HPHPM6_1194 [Helicobacter pylori Hp M6]|nr:hypothetical protein HPHPM6_1194 [Helicobacter pylori Hp M6]